MLYVSPAGPITVRDVIYGWAPEIERSGNDYFAHKTAFTMKSLRNAALEAGFQFCGIRRGIRGFYELIAYAFPTAPTSYHKNLLGLPDLP